MKTSVIGFPRVGKLRELKFATEKYFRNEITAQQLEETAEDIRKYQCLSFMYLHLSALPAS